MCLITAEMTILKRVMSKYFPVYRYRVYYLCLFTLKGIYRSFPKNCRVAIYQ